MEHRILGHTGMSVSTLCLGAMMFGRFGERDRDTSVSIIHRALDDGINFIDTADVYSQGESEIIVGKALAGGRRDDVILATKFHGPMDVPMGQAGDPNNRGNSRRWIVQEVENSLQRLQTDWIDLYQVYRPDTGTDDDETIAALTDLQRQARSGPSVRRHSRHTAWSRTSGSPNAAVSAVSSPSSRRTRCWCEASRPTCSRWPSATTWASSRGARSPAAG